MLTRRQSLALASAGLLAACGPQQRSSTQESSGAPAIGGPFTLVDQDGRPFTEKDLEGHWSAIYFGFTYCPDVCPTSLMALADGLEKMGRRGEAVRTYLISVDPERDTPQAMKAYIANPEFPKNLVGLTGTPEQVAAAAKAYKMYYKKDGEGEGYLVNHQSIIYLMNPKGELSRPLTHELTPDQIASQIGDAMSRKA
jgi:protein SCO1/2